MPTLNPWVIVGAILTVIGVATGGYLWGDSARNTKWLAKTETDKRKAIELALSTERANQEKANAAIRKQAADQAAINTRLRADLAGLRDRPERSGDLPAVSRPGCTGATGAELSRSDAEFLVGEAARADEIRAGLAACYAVIDGVRQ
jgi:hypothetical protein